MRQLTFANDPFVGERAPLANGTYAGSAGRVALVATLGLILTAASTYVTWLGLRSSSGDLGTLIAIFAGIFAVAFALATLTWLVQRLVVDNARVRFRLPMLGTSSMAYAEVRAVVFFPRVYSIIGNTPTLMLLDATGRARFRVSTHPFPLAVLDGIASRVHHTSGAALYVCEQSVLEFSLARSVRLPQLVAP